MLAENCLYSSDEAGLTVKYNMIYARRVPRSGEIKRAAQKYFGLVDERTGKPSDKLDQIGLMFGAGFLEEMAEVGLDRTVANPEGLGDLRTATDLDEREKNAQFGWRQLVSLGDGLRP